MEPVNRKVTYRLYPTAKQETAMLEIKRGHQQLYNAALEQRRAAWRRQRHSLPRTVQEKDLTPLRAEDDTIRRLNAQSSQLTLKRLDLAFQAFFRRVKAGETPGYPRFKSLKRFKGWGYKTHGNGWRLEAGEQMRHGHLRLQGVGKVRLRVRRPKPKPDAIPGQYLPNGAVAKAGLNKAILDGAPAQFLSMLRYKAAEAGAVYVEAPTRTLKPSQTCHQCGRRAQKRLQDRWHTCPCGASCHRDTNAVLVVYAWGIGHVLSVFFAWLWPDNNWSQELTPRHTAQHLPLEPVA